MTKQDDKDLTLAYMVGYHKRDNLIEALREKVKRHEDDPRFSLSLEDLCRARQAIEDSISRMPEGTATKNLWDARNRFKAVCKILEVEG